MLIFFRNAEKKIFASHFFHYSAFDLNINYCLMEKGLDTRSNIWLKSRAQLIFFVGQERGIDQML